MGTKASGQKLITQKLGKISTKVIMILLSFVSWIPSKGPYFRSPALVLCSWAMVDSLRGVAIERSLSYRGKCTLKGVLGSWILPVSFSSALWPWAEQFCSTTLLVPWYACLVTGPKTTGPIEYELQPPKLWALINFSLTSWLSQILLIMMEKLTSTDSNSDSTDKQE